MRKIHWVVIGVCSLFLADASSTLLYSFLYGKWAIHFMHSDVLRGPGYDVTIAIYASSLMLATAVSVFYPKKGTAVVSFGLCWMTGILLATVGFTFGMYIGLPIDSPLSALHEAFELPRAFFTTQAILALATTILGFVLHNSTKEGNVGAPSFSLIPGLLRKRQGHLASPTQEINSHELRLVNAS